jgi:hypothetical protein
MNGPYPVPDTNGAVIIMVVIALLGIFVELGNYGKHKGK